MRPVYDFGSVFLKVFADHVDTIFIKDGAISSFWPMVERPDLDEFVKYAKFFGYANPMQYGREHDVIHSWLAKKLIKPFSRVVWCDAHKISQENFKRECEDEEHLVNRMQKYLNTGETDTDYGILVNTFGTHLPEVGAALWKDLRS